MKVKLKIKKEHIDAIIPKYQTQLASGFDLSSVEEIFIPANSRKVISTGLSFEVPIGYELQVRPRSGISSKTNLSVFLGTVDADYRGIVGVIVHNTSDMFSVIKKGERIAQGVICPVLQVAIEEVNSLSETERGTNGWGSTGK